MKKRSFLILILVVLCSGSVEAFVPTSPHLLHMVVEKIRRPVGIEAFQTRKILNFNDAENPVVEVEERLTYKFPNQLRSDRIPDSTADFSVESEFSFIKVMGGTVVSHQKSLPDYYTDILLYRDYETLMDLLARSGIDTEKVTFQRYNDTICWVVGQPLVKGRPYPGLWIEKETLLPLRYRVEQNGWMLEVYFRNWQKVSKTWYPMQISIFLDDQLFSMINVSQISLKSESSPTFFNIDYIEQRYPENRPEPQDDAARQVEELNQRIEDFKKLYE